MKSLFKKIVSCAMLLALCCGTIATGTVSPLSPAVTVEAATIKLNATSKTLYKNGTYTLKVSGTSKKVTWSSSKKTVATVSSSGKVTAKKAGTCYIYAKVSGKTLKCKITVKNPSPKISATSKTIVKGSTATLSVSGTADTVKWSSSKTSVATVNSSGKVTAKAAGSCYIYAKVNSKTLKCKVTVTNPTLSATSVTLVKGATKTLSVSGASGTVTWSSSKTSVATVSSSGKVTAKAAGTATISAKANGKTLKCTVKVEDPSISSTSLSLTAGSSSTLTVNNNSQSVTWSTSNSSVATVSGGKVTAVSAGTATITAKVTGKTMTCTVTVTSPTVAITSVTLDQSLLLLSSGETGTLNATVSPSNTTQSKTITWTSSNTSIATVNSSGVVTAVSDGVATITAKTSNNLTATCTVTVTTPEVAITSIALDQEELELYTGSSTELTATILPANTTMDTNVTWTSDNEDAATVENGIVTGIGDGTATITATTSNGLTATRSVTVTTLVIDIDSISLDQEEMELYTGSSADLTATISPDNTTMSTDIIWASGNEDVATVEDGTVTAISEGTATITAVSSNGLSATCVVTVLEPSITLSDENITVIVEDTYQLSAEVLDSNTDITWTSSDESVATVDNTGLITGVSAGSAIITASNGHIEKQCTVSVSNGLVEETSVKLIIGDTHQLSLFEEASGLTFTSSDESIASISDDGVVTGVCEGTVTIHVTSDEISDDVEITVVEECAVHDYVLVSQQDDYLVYECSVCGKTKISYGYWETTVIEEEYDEAVYNSHYVCKGCGITSDEFESNDLFYQHCGLEGSSYKTEKYIQYYLHHDAVTETNWIETSYIEY